MSFLAAHCNIIRVSWETKKKRLNSRKNCKEEFVWGTSLFCLHVFLLISFFVAFFVSSPFIRKKKFASENGGDWRPLFPLPSSVYGPDIIEMYFVLKGWYFSFNLIDFAFLKILREWNFQCGQFSFHKQVRWK